MFFFPEFPAGDLFSHATRSASSFPARERGKHWRKPQVFKMAAVASDAATMLAEALQQMDGLISDDQLIMESLKSQTYSCSSKDKVLSLVEELREKLEGMTRDARLTIEVPGSTIDFLTGWLNSLQNVNNSSSVG